MKKFIIIWALLLAHSLVFGQTSPTCQPTITSACTSSFPGGPLSFYISDFTLNSVSSTSSCTAPPNINTSTFATSNLNTGTSYPFSITLFTFFPSSGFGFSHSIWIDANNDGDFTDINEQLFQSSGTFPVTLTGNITIPAATNSGLLHLRVICSEDPTASTNPCGTYTDAEVEDYVVQIAASGGCTPTISSNSPVATGGNISLTSSAATTYAWTGPNGFTSSSQSPTIPSATAINAGIYSLSITTGTCIATATTNVMVTTPATLVASYSFCGNANDGTSNANNGTVNGATLTTDRFGNVSAYNFNGTSNYIEAPSNAALQLGTGDYSFGFWFKTNTSNSTIAMIMKNDANAGYSGLGSYLNYPSSGIVEVRSRSGQALSTNTPPYNDNVWHYVAYTRQGNIQKLYVDNILKVTNTSYSPANISNSLPLTFGAFNDGHQQYFLGALDDIKIYSGALSLSEILIEYNSPAGCQAATCIPSLSSNSPICAGSNLSLTSSTATTYAWTGPNGFTSSMQNPNIPNATTAATGTYTISITAGTCTATTTVSVTVNATPASPTVTPTTSVTVCYNQTATFGGSCPSGSTVSWRNVNGNNVGSGPTFTSFQITGNGSTLYNFYNAFCVNSTTGCSSPPTYFEVLLATPSSLNISNNSPLCKGATLNLTNTVPGSSYSWTGPNGFTSSLQNPSLANMDISKQGTYTLSALVSGCTLTATTNVAVHEAVAYSSSPLCEGVTLNLNSSIQGTPLNYAWSGPNAFSSNLQNPTIASVTAVRSGIYTVTITTTLCIATATTNVVITPLASITNNAPLCEGNALNFTTTTNGIAGQAGVFNAANSQYVTVNQTLPTDNFTIEMWIKTSTANTGLFYAGNPNLSTFSDRHIFVESGILKARIIPIGGAGAVINSGVTVNDNNWHHVAITHTTTSGTGSTIFIDGVSAVNYPTIDGCMNISTLYLGTEVHTGGSQNYYTGQMDNVRIWNVVRTGAEIIQSKNSGFLVANANLVYQQRFENNVNTSIGSNGTAPNGISYTNANITYPNTYSWNGPNSFTSTAQSPTIASIPAAGNGIYTVIVNSGACQSTINSTATVYAKPTPTIGSLAPRCIGGTLNLTSSGGISYSWTGVNSFTSTAQNPNIPSVTNLATGTYMVTVNN